MFEYATIVGRSVVLEPLNARHTPDLIAAALVGQSIFEELRTTHMRDEQAVRDWVARALRGVRSSGRTALPYAIVDTRTARAIGSAYFVNITERHRRCEIGWGWISQQVRSANMQLEARLLMLEHAFANCGIDRVAFRIDRYDEGAHRLLDRLGAECEGVLRRDYVDADGQSHDSAIYGVTIDRWPQVRERVELRLGGPITAEDRARALERLHDAQQRRVAPQSLELPLPRAG